MDSIIAALDGCSGGLVSLVLEKVQRPPLLELISDEGDFKEADFKNFLTSVKLHQYGGSYAVVAIIGKQSSGKSTLMNHLFRTNFTELNALHGRRQVTKGIWIEKARLEEPFTLVLDLEGTDGLERGENTKFERQSALFALAVADVLIINMWCKDMGLENAANRPLLKAIFEAMMRLFSPNKTTLLFVLRDKTKTPVDKLEGDLREDVEKIWETILKPQGREDTPLSDIFNVEVIVLSNYEEKPDIFVKEVAQLRLRFMNSILLSHTERHDNNASEVIPFSDAKKTWDMIKGCKDLDLPSHKVMVATVRCEEIAMEKLSLFASNEDWLILQKEATAVLVSDFSTRIRAILDIYLSEYDSECIRYEEDVSKAKREYLISEASKVFRPAYMDTLGHRRSNALRSFETRLKTTLNEGGGFAESVRTCQECCVLEFDEQRGSDDATFSNDVSTVRHELLRDIENHWHLVRSDKLPQIAEQQRERLSSTFSRQLRYFLSDYEEEDIWGRIRNMVRSESDAAALALSSAVAKFELDTATLEKIVDDLKQSAKELMVNKLKHETQDIQQLLTQRFVTAFIMEKSVGNAKDPTKDGYRKCVKLLSTMAVIRLDEREDNVESVLLSALLGADQVSPDPLASHAWEKVPPEMTLTTPVRCRDIWNQLKPELEKLYPTAKVVEEECVKAKYWRPPTWIIMGLLGLGCVAVLGILRVTNIDVLLALGCALPVIGMAVDGIGLAVAGMDIVQEGIDTYTSISEINQQQQDDCTGFWRKHRNILKTIKQALKKFLKRMKSFLAKREAVEVAA